LEVNIINYTSRKIDADSILLQGCKLINISPAKCTYEKCPLPFWQQALNIIALYEPVILN
jgi:hypothetical protein